MAINDKNFFCIGFRRSSTQCLPASSGQLITPTVVRALYGRHMLSAMGPSLPGGVTSSLNGLRIWGKLSL